MIFCATPEFSFEISFEGVFIFVLTFFENKKSLILLTVVGY